MIYWMTRIALIVTAAGLLPSEDGWAVTADSDPDNRPAALTTLDRGVGPSGSGDLIELAQARNRPPSVQTGAKAEEQRRLNRATREDTRLNFTIQRRIFTDRDGDRLTITARESVNANWLRVNGLTLSGTPRGLAADARVRVRATDGKGGSAATTFTVTVIREQVDDGKDTSQSTPSPDPNGTSDSTQPSISGDGRFVAHVFENVETDPPEQSIVVRDFTFADFSGRGSLTVAGPEAFAPLLASAALFSSPSISADGRIVAFVAQTAPEARVQGVDVRVVRIADSEPLDLETRLVQSILRSDDPVARDELVFSTDVSLSADGRIVAFERGTNIVVAKIGTRRRLIIRNASSPSLSRNGRRIAYEEVTDSEERDIRIATLDVDRMRVLDTTVVGVDRDSEFGPLPSNPVVSADGNFVAFESGASDLDLAPPDVDTNGARDIFVFNVREGTLSLASVDADGEQAEADSFNPSLSADGRLVAFDIGLPNFVPQVLVRELNSRGEPIGAPRIVSVDSAGNPGNLGGGGGSFRPSLSADARFVSFMSTSTNLTEDATNNRGVAVFLASTFPGCEVEFGIVDDPQGNSCTQAALERGVPSRGEIAPAFDADWYQVGLIEGESYRFELQADSSSATPLGDPFLELRDTNGNLVASDDDSGGGLSGLDALLDFPASSSGTFFVAARGVDDATGDYVLSVVTLPPAVTVSR